MDESQICFTLLVVDEEGDIYMPSEVDGEVKLLPCPLILSKSDFEEADIKKPEELDQLVDELADEIINSDDAEEDDEEDVSEDDSDGDSGNSPASSDKQSDDEEEE